MDNLPVIPISNAPGDSRDRKVNSNITQNKSIQSSDVVLKSGPHGTTINLKPRHKRQTNGLEHAGDFNPSASYYPNQVVRITSSSLAQYPFLSSSLGLWKCEMTVPAQGVSDAFQAAGYDQNKYPGYIRRVGVIYYPYRPEPTTVASGTNPNGRYSGYSDYYVSGYKSGSAS
jgi:hypothetical protein